MPLQPNFKVPPLLLCSICSFWRQVALNTPALWGEIALQLEYVSVRSHLGGGLLRQKLRVLELWTSRMGNLPPSLHLGRSHLRVHVSNDEDEISRRFATFAEFFSCTSISTAQLLSFHSFSAPDLMWLSKVVSERNFDNLNYVVLSQPSGREHNSSIAGFTKLFSNTSAPNLKRLYIDSHSEVVVRPAIMLNAFSWPILTHLAANFKLRPLDWYSILDQCVSLTHCTVKLHFLHAQQTFDLDIRKPISHSPLQELSVQTVLGDVNLILDKFDLPNLLKLRISIPETTIRIFELLVTLLSSTPCVKELHLQGCIPFGTATFAADLPQVPSSGNTSPHILNRLLPCLETLVIDGIDHRVPLNALPGDLLKFLRSSWLCNGWEKNLAIPRTVEFILDTGHHFGLSILRDLMQGVDEKEDGRLPCPFQVKARNLRNGLWQWKQMSGIELRDGWAGCAKWTTK